MIQAIAEARAQGDLSENAEYEAAKDKQGFIEGRILEIEGKLAAAQVIDPSTLDAGGRWCSAPPSTWKTRTAARKVTYQIVGDDEADLKLGLISIGSPIARALIGKSSGDVAEVQAPGGGATTRSSTSATSERQRAERDVAGVAGPLRAGCVLAGRLLGAPVGRLSSGRWPAPAEAGRWPGACSVARGAGEPGAGMLVLLELALALCATGRGGRGRLLSSPPIAAALGALFCTVAGYYFAAAADDGGGARRASGARGASPRCTSSLTGVKGAAALLGWRRWPPG